MPISRSSASSTWGAGDRAVALALVSALLLIASAVTTTRSAEAVTGDALYVYGPDRAVVGQRLQLNVSWVHGGEPVTGRVNLQRRSGDRWVHVRQLSVSEGTAITEITPGAPNSYRLRTSSATSPGGVPTAHPDGTSNTISVRIQASLTYTSAPQLRTPVVAEVGSGVAGAISWHRGSVPVTGRVNLQRWDSDHWTHVRQVQVNGGTATTIVMTSGDTRYRLRASSVASPGSVAKYHPFGTSAVARVVAEADVPESFAVSGAGWGHGVGMSQYGAYGMALDGSDAEDILTHYYSGAQVSARSLDDLVRVQVLDGAANATVRVSGGPARVRLGGSIVATLAAGEQIAVRPVPTGLRLTYNGQSWTTAGVTNRVHVEWAGTRYYQPTRTSPVVTTVTGAQGVYRHGRLELRNIDGRVNGVDVLDVAEEYMLGIAEMPSSWSPAALQAQVIAARSYALATMPSSVRNSCDCHLYDDTRSQNYTGWTKENESTYGTRWVAAVEATIDSVGRADVVTFGSSVAQTYYYSSSGGRTQNSEDVWSTRLPYLRSVDDPWSLASRNPYSSWRTSVDQRTMAAAFRLSNVRSVDILSRTHGGGIRAAQATANDGSSATLTGEQLRSRLGLRSTWIYSIR